MELYNIYRPITAAPFQADGSYREVLPCEALRPYIRCFWGTDNSLKQPGPVNGGTRLVIPDTCMDIIFDICGKDGKTNGTFFGIDDTAYQTGCCHGEGTANFAIRFYAWSAILFAEEDMKNVCNLSFEAGQYFSKLQAQLTPLLQGDKTLEERAAAAERVLLKHLRAERENVGLMNAIYEMLVHRGSIKAADIARGLHVSLRQLERICKENTGVSPKKLSSLIRYQYLWNDALFRPFDVMDAVERYGYTDQAHLIRDFKRYHSMTPRQAREKALYQCDPICEKTEKMS